MSEGATLTWALLLGLGLSLVLGALTALVHGERARMARIARLDRAVGRGTAEAAIDTVRPLRHGLRQRLAQALRLAGERLSVILGGEARETAAELASAGYRGRDALLAYAFGKSVLPVLALLIGLGHVIATVAPGTAMILPVARVIALALALSKGIDLWVDQVRRRRLARIRNGFPDLLELLVITSEAGLGPQPALHRVAREMVQTHPDLAGEVLEMVQEMRMTNDRRQAYARLNARVPLPEVAVFTQTLDQSDTYGTPFSRAMRTLINETRTARMMQVEETAARLPVLMTMPLIFCIMPAVFVVLVGPAVLNVIDNILGG